MTYERILVTGASGFVGCRVVEHLRLGRDLLVRAAFHSPSHAARLARLDAELVQLDLADPRSIAAAVQGCDAIVHCAYGTTGSERERRSLTGKATASLLDAALASGVRRVVHLSSVAVWGFRPKEAVLDESVPLRRTGHPYVDGKVDAEEALAAAHRHGLFTVVLRPSNVIGPFSQSFTTALVQTLREGGVALVGPGDTPSNAIYVDDVVHGVLRALETERGAGEAFVLSDGGELTWRALLERYAAMLDPTPPVRAISPEEWRRARGRTLRRAFAEARSLARSPEAVALARAVAERPALRSVARTPLRFLPQRAQRLKAALADSRLDGAAAATQPASALPSEELAALQTSGVRLRTDKARELLGWQPVVGLEEGLRLTAAWLRFARPV